MTQTALLIGVGITGGFIAGLLGLGGAVVLSPLLLTVPHILGLSDLSVHAVASITLLYGLLWAAVSLWSRRIAGGKELRLLLVPGLAGAGAALVGGLVSARLPGRALLFLLAAFATVAGLLLLVPRRPAGRKQESGSGPARARPSAPGRAQAKGRGLQPVWSAALASAGTGAVSGLVGAAGGFLLEPLIARLVGPRRAAETTVVGIVLFSAMGGLAGKGLTGQVDLWLAAPLVAGAVPATWWGAELARRLSPRRLAGAAVAFAWAAAAWLWLLAVPELGRRVRPGHLYLLAALPAVVAALWMSVRRRRGGALFGPRIRAWGPTDAPERLVDPLPPLLPEELRRMVQEGPLPQIIDLRDPAVALSRPLPGGVNIPWPQLEAWLDVADPADGAVFVCDDGVLSPEAVALAAMRGHRTRYLEGGAAAWETLDSPTPQGDAAANGAPPVYTPAAGFGSDEQPLEGL
ncbi:MAG: TSUP family transporter [Symbiobacterium sp.]|uniref:TSUP family transporter n=1 Tax=Symbiobacterium sp. TaxID=1971213 RepID=UPI003463D916